jgi:hypothetical protein
MKIIRLAIVSSIVLLAACQAAPKPASTAPAAVPQATAAPATAAATTAGPLADWKPFKSAEGGFSLMLPEEPTSQTQAVDTAAGKVDTYIFMSSQGNNVYGISYNDFPAAAVQQSADGIKAMLEASRDGAARNVKGKVVNSKAVTLDGHPGIDFVAELPVGDALPAGATYHGRTFLVGNRLYQLLTIATDKGQDEIVAAFLESFKLTP